MKHQFANRMKPITALTLLCLVIALLCGCSKESNLNTLSCNLDEASSYPEVLQQMLPSLRVEQSVNRAYHFLDNGAISEGGGVKISDSMIRYNQRKGAYHTVRNFNTAPDEFFRIAFRENFYESVEALQEDLDKWLVHYNTERPHRGYRSRGKRPLDTVLEFAKIVRHDS